MALCPLQPRIGSSSAVPSYSWETEAHREAQQAPAGWQDREGLGQQSQHSCSWPLVPESLLTPASIIKLGQIAVPSPPNETSAQRERRKSDCRKTLGCKSQHLLGGLLCPQNPQGEPVDAAGVKMEEQFLCVVHSVTKPQVLPVVKTA